MFRLAGAQYVGIQPNDEGWLRSETMQVRFRHVDTSPPRLRIDDVLDRTSSVEI
jgi:hypothetical protein